MSIPMALPIMVSILEITKLAVSCTSGITPARAGKTQFLSADTASRRDHPRSCEKDSNGSLYFRPFTPADIQNLFNFFAKHLTSSASPNAR